MAGKENLRTPTTEQAREIGRKGGKASAKARKRKKELKELLELALSQPSGIEDGEDNYTAITAALVQRAIHGDTKAYEVIRDTLGQKPTEQVQTDLTAKIEVDYGE
jgi:general stress protein YciG